MIQRIQTVYLLIVAIFMVLFLWDIFIRKQACQT